MNNEIIALKSTRRYIPHDHNVKHSVVNLIFMLYYWSEKKVCSYLTLNLPDRLLLIT